MKSEEKEKKTTVNYSELNVGDTFLWRNNLLLKSDVTSNDFYLSVKLDTGEIYFLTNYDQVEKVDCHLTYIKV